MRSLLDHQADGIEFTLHSHGIEASVQGGNISPRLVQFNIKLGPGVKFNRVSALADELALALGVSHCRITREGYFVRVEVPRPDPVAVRLFPLMRNLPGDLPPNSPVLGLDESGVPLLLRIDSPDISHILITGSTGSGKTVMARSMIASLALQNSPDDVKLLLIDPKGRGYREFEGLANLVCPVVYDPLDAVHRLKWAVRHLDKREESGVSSPLLVIFIDELADLVLAGGKEVEYLVSHLTQRGRECGIHLVASTHKPTRVASSAFPARLVGRVNTAEEARLASGQAGSGADKLMGRGDFLLFARGEVIRVQGAHISPDEMQQTVHHLEQSPAALPAEQARSRRSLGSARPEPGRGRRRLPAQEESYPVAQSFSRPQYDYDDEAPEDEGYEGESDGPPYDYYSGGRQRANNSRPLPARQPRSPHPEPSEGVNERLARYKHELQQRRQSNRVAEDDYDDQPEYYHPARSTARPQAAGWKEARHIPTTPGDDLELSLDDLEDGSEDFNRWQEDEPETGDELPAPPPARSRPPVRGAARPMPATPPEPARSRPTPLPGKPGQMENGRTLIDNLKARSTSESFKIGS